MRVVILTSNHFRHHYVVNELAKDLNVVGVVSEEKSFIPLRYSNSPEEDKIINNHFQLREEVEREYFDKEFKSGIPLLSLPMKSINKEETLSEIKKMRPDYIVVYGTGIIHESIINTYPNKILNIHLGLSPYYRGSGTNFFPIVNNEPEYCGVTIHYLDRGIDTGSIIMRGRAVIDSNDSIHSLGCKNIRVGTYLIKKSLKEINKGGGVGSPQNHSLGKNYFRKDFNAETVNCALENIKNGLFKKYEELQYKKLMDIEIIKGF